MIREGVKENVILLELYTMPNDEVRVILMLATHVDDLLRACEPEAQHIVSELPVWQDRSRRFPVLWKGRRTTGRLQHQDHMP